jgi:hypothetical protein
MHKLETSVFIKIIIWVSDYLHCNISAYVVGIMIYVLRPPNKIYFYISVIFIQTNYLDNFILPYSYKIFQHFLYNSYTVLLFVDFMKLSKLKDVSIHLHTSIQFLEH